jgi:putative SOS response-associated peptidase YedK
MAGLYEFKKLTDEELAVAGDDPAAATGWLVTTTILTTEAQGHLAEVHDRMPVMMAPGSIEEWTAPQADADGAAEALARLLDANDPDEVERFRVGTEVGNVRNQGAHLAQPLG